MNPFKKTKSIVLIIVVLIPMLMIFSAFIKNTIADTDIPGDYYGTNTWQWGIDEGDKLMFEINYTVSDPETKEIVHSFKDIIIYNISSITNVSELVDSSWIDYSQVNSTRLYYNSTFDSLEPLNDQSSLLVEFAFNKSHPMKYDYKMEENAVPLILPLNRSNSIEWENVTKILNDTLFTNMAKDNFSKFDQYNYNQTENSMRFWNTTDGYYIEASYYAENGTIKDCEGCILIPFSEYENSMMLNFTAFSVFEYNITEDLMWGVDVGDTFYYDFAEKSHKDNNSTDDYKDIEAGSIKAVITKINDSTFWIPLNNFDLENSSSPMVFQGIYANIYFWNYSLNNYDLMEKDYLIGAANNFYPLIIREDPQFIIPTSASKTDFEYVFEEHLFRSKDMPYDQLDLTWGNIIDFKIWNSTGSEIVKIKINSTSGIYNSFLMKSDYNFMYFELKDMTYIEWAVDIGDYYYFKESFENKTYERRVTVFGFTTFFDNVSFYLNEFFGKSLPANQPELQFFSVVLGTVEYWDPFMEIWVNENESTGTSSSSSLEIKPIAAANKYWAIAPQMLQQGPPLLLPEGTKGSDTEFQAIFNLMDMWFDDLSYGIDWVVLKNTTENTWMSYNFSAITGMTTLIYGWMVDFEDYYGFMSWNYFSAYLEYSIILSTGLNEIKLQSLFVTDIAITANISVLGNGAEFIYALNKINPVNIPLYQGNSLFYLDLKITNHSILSENITLTIEFPLFVDLNTYYLYFFGFNMDNTDTWAGAPQEFYDSIIYNYINNSIAFELPMEGPLMILVAVSYGLEPPIMRPGNFTLYSDADTPDDGNFVLSWSESSGADSYSVYVSDHCITDIYDLMIPLVEGINDTTYSINSFPNGTYYFIIVAENIAGKTLSNCLEITIGTGQEVPGFNLLFVILAFASVTIIITKRSKKQK